MAEKIVNPLSAEHAAEVAGFDVLIGVLSASPVTVVIPHTSCVLSTPTRFHMCLCGALMHVCMNTPNKESE